MLLGVGGRALSQGPPNRHPVLLQAPWVFKNGQVLDLHEGLSVVGETPGF